MYFLYCSQKFWAIPFFPISYNYSETIIGNPFRLGQLSTIDEHTTVAHHAVNIAKTMSGNPSQVRVLQGKEPAHLLKIFQNMVIHK